MNGSANGFAGALFFSLAAIGIILSVEGIIGWGLGAFSAACAALCVRSALIHAAEAAEEDHQRIEIQFQQLRNKVGENSSSNTLALNSISEISDALQENLQGMRTRLAALDNLQTVAETNSAIGSVLKSIEDNTGAAEKSFKEFNGKLEKNFKILSETLSTLSENVEKICTLEETNKAALQTGIKLMQVFGQILKTPAFAKDIEKVAEKINLLDDVQKNLSDSKEEISALVKISEEISKQNSEQNSGFENFGEVGAKIISSAEILTQTFNEMKKEMSDLTKKIEAYNGLTKATLDQYSNLTEQDVRILERITEKINGN